MDINAQLEKQWKSYRLRILLVKFFWLGIIVCLFALLIYFYIFSSSSNTKSKPTNKNLLPPKTVQTPNFRPVFLSMSFSFEENLSQALVPKQNAQPLNIRVESKISKPPKPQVLNAVPKIYQTHSFDANGTKAKPDTNNQDIVFVRQKTTSLEDLKSAFLQEKSYEKALIIAKTYFESSNYQEAINWAIKANEIDESKEDAWIIFANANIKQGNKQKALNAIDAYLKKYFSEELSKLKDSL